MCLSVGLCVCLCEELSVSFWVLCVSLWCKCVYFCEEIRVLVGAQCVFLRNVCVSVVPCVYLCEGLSEECVCCYEACVCVSVKGGYDL